MLKYNKVKTKLSIQTKAGLLLLVFLLNTMVVFGCSLSMDMKSTSSCNYKKICDSSVLHHKKESQHHKKDKDNCCKDEAIKFAKVDKLSPSQNNQEINLVGYPVLFFVYYDADSFKQQIDCINYSYIFLNHHPPISDIRIAIQSFQI